LTVNEEAFFADLIDRYVRGVFSCQVKRVRFGNVTSLNVGQKDRAVEEVDGRTLWGSPDNDLVLLPIDMTKQLSVDDNALLLPDFDKIAAVDWVAA